MGMLQDDIVPFTKQEATIYWKLVQVNYASDGISPASAHIVFNGWLSQEARAAGAQPAIQKSIEVGAEVLNSSVPTQVFDAVKQVVYAFAKSPGQPFAGAQDVLEPGQP